MLIRPRTSADAAELLDIWLRAVRATHDFLAPSDIDELLPLVRNQYLPAVEVWVALDEQGQPAGFIGLDGAQVEMLFIDPQYHGQGMGRALLDHARGLHGTLTVDVNEQNPQAVGFYRHYGFQQTGRSPLDGQGRPFPLLHLSL
ncbi:MAG: putative N-acetyltransferase YjaB [Pseudomonas citronellolis]|nr:MAG: putative N-acetyltransferase YjaB [Pseudomonas citronellolis]